MKVFFCVNLPSPYRVDFFNELGKLCDLTVIYERKTASDRDSRWKPSIALTYNEVYLPLKPIGTDRSRGSALRKYIASHSCDRLIITNYVSQSCIEAILYCRLKKISYWVEYDGGFNRTDSIPKRLIKRILLGAAVGHLTTSDEHIKYLKTLGIDSCKIFKYPFTSLSVNDLKNAEGKKSLGKAYYRKKLHMTERRIILSVGQFIYRKGFDLLIAAAKELPDIGVYIVGGKPSEEYLSLVAGHENIHFVGFQLKEELAEYYCAADLMVLLTREDIWGLVVNEALAYGLPVITTDRCVAGMEIIRNGKNGFIVPAGTYEEAVKCIQSYFMDYNLQKTLQVGCLESIKKYTIEKMASEHIRYLEGY